MGWDNQITITPFWIREKDWIYDNNGYCNILDEDCRKERHKQSILPWNIKYIKAENTIPRNAAETYLKLFGSVIIY